MFYSRNKATNIVAITSVLMIGFGIYLGYVNGYTVNIFLLGTFIVINCLFIYLTETNKVLIYLLVFAFIADSIVISEGFTGVNFNFLNPIIFFVFAYLFISKKQVSITLSIIALVLLGINILTLMLYNPGMLPLLIGPGLFFVASFLNIINIHSSAFKSEGTARATIFNEF